MAHAVSNLRVAPVLAPLIIGGGPSGAAAACVLAAAGHAVTLLERQAGPSDKLCGDFLSGGAVAAVRALALEPLTLGAMPLQTIRLVHRRSVAEADLPFAAMGLSRRTLDDALLRRAAQCGATVCRGQAVHGLQATPAGFAVRAGGLGTLESEAVFLATGKHDLRGLARAPQDDGLLGL